MQRIALFPRSLAPLAAAWLMAAVAIPGAAVAGPDVGRPAPEFTGTDSNGKRVRLSDYRGKTVVLEWTNHDCPFVARHYGLGNMQKLQKDARAQGTIWLSVISSAPGEQGHVKGDHANRLSQSRGAAPTRIIVDEKGAIGRLYGAVTTPHMYIVDAKGTLRYMGAIDSEPTAWGKIAKDTRNYVRHALADLRAGRPVAEPLTRPYGCSVKYAPG